MRLLISFVSFAVFVFSTLACATTLKQNRTLDAYDCAAGFKNNQVVREELESCLSKDGVRLEIHGVVPEQRLAVVTFRNPQNFFSYEHLSLLAATPELRAEIFKLNRHDIVIVKGEIVDHRSPQKHLRASSLVVEKKSTASEELDSYPYEGKIPDDLLNKTQFTALVHAIHGDGQILVLEYKDTVVPVFVEPQWTHLTRDLFRNDLIEVEYAIQEKPGRPVHLNLFPHSANGPLTVKESLVALHGKSAKLSGELVMFPKSHQVAFNVFALRETVAGGARRYYTLVNFEDMKVFEAIRLKLQTAWDQNAATKQKDRNKWINTQVIVTAEGTLNVQEANQANPQILLKSPDQIRLQIRE